MDRKVVLVSAQKSFMVNAMTKNLNGESYEVVYQAPRVKDIMKDERWTGEGHPNLMLLYIDNDVEEMSEFLVWLKDRVTEDEGDWHVFMVGNELEIREAEKFFPEKYVSGIFVRPLNVKELVEKFNALLEEDVTKERKKHILVVDDDGTMLRTLKLWLSDKYRVYMANSGMNAISLLARNQVDLILLDYEMPVASGPQVLEMIRNEPSTANVPVMFLTAKNDKESVMSVMNLRPEKYLLKTMPPDELMRNIDDFFELQKAKGQS